MTISGMPRWSQVFFCFCIINQPDSKYRWHSFCLSKIHLNMYIPPENVRTYLFVGTIKFMVDHGPMEHQRCQSASSPYASNRHTTLHYFAVSIGSVTYPGRIPETLPPVTINLICLFRKLLIIIFTSTETNVTPIPSTKCFTNQIVDRYLEV